ERRRFLQRDSHSQLQRRHPGPLHHVVIPAHNLDDFPRQHARPAHCQPGLPFTLQNRQDDRVAFQEHFLSAVFGEQLVHRIEKIQTEIRRRVHPLVHHRARQPSRVTHVGLHHHVAQHSLCIRLQRLLWQQKLIQRPVHSRQFPHPLVRRQVHRVEGCIQRFQPPQVPMIQKEVVQKSRRQLRPLRPPTPGHFLHRRVQALRRKLAMILYHPFHTVAFRPVYQSILQLLGIDARRILGKQRHHVIRGDHVLYHLLVFQQPHPTRQTLLLHHTLI